ncbi:MAG TPA: hypothetical protein VFG78_02785 [Gemmatimonadota bacterium]|nr:hypothetical protein [Gemmatimonadota bacterium]
MRRTRLVIQATWWVAVLVAPGSGLAQSGEGASVWQYGLRDVGWEAVERLQEEVREYREAGAIGTYELLIRTNGVRFDAMVIAEIVDATGLAELRDLDGIGTAPEAAVPEANGDESPS